MKHALALVLALFLPLIAFADDPEPMTFPTTVDEITVTGWDGFAYIVDDGSVIWSGEAEPSLADLSDAIASPRPKPSATTVEQTLEVVVSRLTSGEIDALLGSTDSDVRRFLELARIRGKIRPGSSDFLAAKALLDSLNIITAARWDTILAP